MTAPKETIADAIANPHAHDNKGFLGQGRDQAVIDGRIRSPRKQIDNFKKLLEECESLNGK